MARKLVLYHAQCADGFCAAWVAHRQFGDDADYIPVQYGQDPPEVTGRDVYILDFSYKRPVMEAIRRNAVTLTVVDHHKTAQTELQWFGARELGEPGTVCCVFDMHKSGGRLTWEYFFSEQPAPWLVDYTEDRDLWKWKLPLSKELSAALTSHPRTFEQWDLFADIGPLEGKAFGNKLYDSRLSLLATEGAAIIRYQDQLVATHVENAAEVEIDGYKVLAVNATCLISEIAGKLAEGRPFGATYFHRRDGKRVWSLRSRGDGADVSEIAKSHGGGGHKQAAGFTE